MEQNAKGIFMNPHFNEEFDTYLLNIMSNIDMYKKMGTGDYEFENDIEQTAYMVARDKITNNLTWRGRKKKFIDFN